MQNHVISKKNKSHVFHWKRTVGDLECRRLQTNLAVKTTWSESLTCSTIILWYISSLECQRFMSCNATLEGPRGKSNRFISSSYATERGKMASSWEKSREICSNNYSKGPNRIVWSSWPTTLWHMSISWLVRNTSNRPPSSKQMEDRSCGKKSLKTTKVWSKCRISVAK